MDENKVIGKCSFCPYEGYVTKVNGNAQACDDCLPFVWTRRNPGQPLPESFSVIKSAFAN